MSIKLSIKELKDLLKLNKLAIKKRKRSKKRLGKAIQNQNIRSTSAHMISSGTTMMNTANEQGELIRLQRQALEDKLKDDKENRIKKEAKEKEAKEQNDLDNAGGMVPYDRLSGNGGRNTLRKVEDLSNNVNYLLMNINQYRPQEGEVQMVRQGSVNNAQTNTKIIPGTVEEVEEVEDVFSEKVPATSNANLNSGFIDEKDNEAEEEKVFDPIKLNIKYANKGQLVGFIQHFDQTETGLINMSNAQLKLKAETIKLNIKLKEEAEARAEALKVEKEAEEKAKAEVRKAKAKAKKEAEAKAAQEAEAKAAQEAAEAKAKEEAEAEAAKKMARKLRKEAEAKAKEEAEAKAKEEAEAEEARAIKLRKAQAAQDEDDKSLQGVSIRKIPPKTGTRISSIPQPPVKKGR